MSSRLFDRDMVMTWVKRLRSHYSVASCMRSSPSDATPELAYLNLHPCGHSSIWAPEIASIPGVMDVDKFQMFEERPFPVPEMSGANICPSLWQFKLGTDSTA